MFQNESTGLGKGASGKYEHGYLMCDFTRTILLPDTTKEIGASFDLIKNKFHIIMARASSLTKNAENGRKGTRVQIWLIFIVPILRFIICYCGKGRNWVTTQVRKIEGSHIVRFN